MVNLDRTHLTTSAKFTFEIVDLKHIYTLFTVRELRTPMEEAVPT